jgi:hypothetical protein
MKDKCLCGSCTNSMVTKCFKPINDGLGSSMMEEQSDVLNLDGTCDYYNHRTISIKIKDYIRYKLYAFKMRILDIKVLFRHNLYGRLRYGFDLTDLWSLDSSITKFVYPRLKQFIKQGTQGHPGLIEDDKFIKDNNLSPYVGKDGMETWNNILNKMLLGFEALNKQEDMYSDESQSNVEEGLRLFALFYQNLWD